MRDDRPFSQHYDLGDLGRGGAQIEVAAHGEDLARIAQWAGVRAVEDFAAAVTLTRKSATQFALDADLVADIVQDCVVTLEPVRSRIEKPIHRELHVAERVRLKPHESVPLGAGAGDDEVPEEIESLDYDLAAPLLEEFALAIDPYPRAPGAEFAASKEPEARAENPFAVLKRLKNPS
ncbi:MAG TPA: YceD family protein [Rhizomicrobium sp.]|nr:YceD family protein [Rhizomicrobium sp.]